MEISVLGIDLAKTVFQLHGVNRSGKVVLRKKLSRGQLLEFVANLPRCLIGMEACGGANYWAREFRKFGHDVKLIAPQFVKPYVKSNKNDVADAEAICEAVSRPNMRFVPIKQVEQQDIQSLHRVRERLVKTRTALSNETRGLLQEYGIILPKQVSQLRMKLPLIIESADNQLTTMGRDLLRNLLEELQRIDYLVSEYDKKIKAIHDAHPVCKRLSKIPGVGPITATALIASVSDPGAFRNGRELAAWLGLVPRQSSSGGKEKLLGISKRGDVYIRKLLIHGARSALYWIEGKEDRRSIWVKKIIEKRGMNRAAVALANKNARTIWVLMARGEEYRVAA